MNRLRLILLLVCIFAYNMQGHTQCIQKLNKERQYDIILYINESFALSDSCIKTLFKDSNLKQYTRFKVIFSESIQELPASFFKLDHIKVLHLEGTQNLDYSVKEKITKDFNAFTSLEELKIVNLPISSISKKVAWPNLKYFEAHYCNLVVLPKSLFSKKLEKLIVSYANVSVIPEAICNAKKLKELALISVPIEVLPCYLFELKHLKILGLDGTNVSVIPDDIEKMVQLEQISLLTMTGIEYCSNFICKLQNLEKISALFTKPDLIPFCFKDETFWKKDGTDWRRLN